MARTIADNLLYNGKKPLDARTQFETVSQMQAFDTNFLSEGLIAYCLDTKKNYKFDGTEWKPLEAEWLLEDSIVYNTNCPTKADLNAIDLTTLPDNTFQVFLVENDETADHYVDGSGNVVSVAEYEANKAAYDADSDLQCFYKYITDYSEYDYAYINDSSKTPYITDIDLAACLYTVACYSDDEISPAEDRELKFVGKIKYKVVYDDKKLDVEFMMEGVPGENEGYVGTPKKASTTDYIYTTLEDFSRWLKPFYDPELLEYDTYADLSNVDISLLEKNKVYIATVKNDETHFPSSVCLTKLKKIDGIVYDCLNEDIEKNNFMFTNENQRIQTTQQLDNIDVVVADEGMSSTTGWLYHKAKDSEFSFNEFTATTKEQVEIAIGQVHNSTLYLLINNDTDFVRPWKYIGINKNATSNLQDPSIFMLEYLL